MLYKDDNQTQPNLNYKICKNHPIYFLPQILLMRILFIVYVSLMRSLEYPVRKLNTKRFYWGVRRNFKQSAALPFKYAASAFRIHLILVLDYDQQINQT